MKTQQKYVPVGCDFVDQIEILATKRKQVQLVYFNEVGQQEDVTTIVQTWETLNKEEFLVTTDGLRIRLDKVLSIDGQNNEDFCSL